MILNQKEQQMFNSLAHSSYAKTLLTFLDKLVLELVDIRNISDSSSNTDVERKARELSVSIIEREIINRFRVLSGRIEVDNNNNYI